MKQKIGVGLVYSWLPATETGVIALWSLHFFFSCRLWWQKDKCNSKMCFFGGWIQRAGLLPAASLPAQSRAGCSQRQPDAGSRCAELCGEGIPAADWQLEGQTAAEVALLLEGAWGVWTCRQVTCRPRALGEHAWAAAGSIEYLYQNSTNVLLKWVD